MERFFRYGSLELPIQGHDEPFIWGVWVELAPADYARDEDLGEVQGREKEPPYHGVFAVEIPFYEQRTEGLAVFLHERPVGVRPSSHCKRTRTSCGPNSRMAFPSSGPRISSSGSCTADSSDAGHGWNEWPTSGTKVTVSGHREALPAIQRRRTVKTEGCRLLAPTTSRKGDGKGLEFRSRPYTARHRPRQRSDRRPNGSADRDAGHRDRNDKGLHGCRHRAVQRREAPRGVSAWRGPYSSCFAFCPGCFQSSA